MTVHTPGKLADVPNQPKTKIRGVRVPDNVWEAAQAAADAKGQNLSEEIRNFLKRYAKTGPKR